MSTNKGKNVKGRPAHSGFEGPTIGEKATTPAKYLPNGTINPEWKKWQAEGKSNSKK